MPPSACLSELRNPSAPGSDGHPRQSAAAAASSPKPRRKYPRQDPRRSSWTARGDHPDMRTRPRSSGGAVGECRPCAELEGHLCRQGGSGERGGEVCSSIFFFFTFRVPGKVRLLQVHHRYSYFLSIGFHMYPSCVAVVLFCWYRHGNFRFRFRWLYS